MSKSVGRLTRKIDRQEYDVNFKDRSICHVPASKSETVKMLRQFVFNECGKCWSQLPAPIATLKRQFLREMIEKLDIP